MISQIIKVDTYTKEKKTWCEKNAYPSEPIFVPNPDGMASSCCFVISYDKIFRKAISSSILNILLLGGR